MATKKKKNQKLKKQNYNTRNYNDIYALTLLGLSILSIIFIFTSATGVVGKYINVVYEYGVGSGRFVLPAFLAAMGIYLFASKSKRYYYFAAGLTISFISILSFMHSNVNLQAMFKVTELTQNGGVIGAIFAFSFKYLLGSNASFIIFAFTFGGGLMIMTNKSLTDIWHNLTEGTGKIKNRIEENQPISEKLTQKVDGLKKVSINTKAILPKKEVVTEVVGSSHETIEIAHVENDSGYQLPSLDMFPLTKPPKISPKKYLNENIRTLQKTLDDFDVDASISRVVTGPTVTRYEIQLASGVKVNKILNLADDIALAFASPDVRILAPIPGKSAIGIEVPNTVRELVTVGDILRTEQMQNSKSLLSIVIGKDISGEPVISDLAAMPHLLIAGATGSGKSVCINSIITTLLVRATPDQVKMILIDPKRVELSLFNHIPHLLTPVVTQPKQASNVLEWAVSEMESRYETLASLGVKHITSYNELMVKQGNEKMPYIVIVIDELADLMMVAARDVEDAICRLAQLARAIGIHLVIATQRPSTDVITGLIKANITHRIAFAVSSQIDSRVVLDSVGAEKLIGKGDMLLSTPQSIKPKRVQATYVSEKEIEDLCAHLKAQADPSYVQDIITPKKSDFSFNGFEDELYDQAVETVVSSGKASVSYLQRRLRVGYGRAARLMDMLEERSVVSPQDGSKPREVLITPEELASVPVED